MASSQGEMMSLIGHGWALEYLRKQQRQGRLRHSYLLLGQPQIGKMTLALTFAAGLLCDSADEPQPCGHCCSCERIRRNTHPDVIVIEPAGASFTIEQVRDLEAELPLTPKEKPVKIRILTDFELATREAQNALLKTLEEPPAHALLFLTASEGDLLAPTIVSRCQTLSLRSVPTKEIEAGLLTHGAPPGEAQALSLQAHGRPGWALRALADPGLRQRRAEALRSTKELIGQRRAERLRYAESLGTQERASVLEVLGWWKLWWHDLLLIASGATTGYALTADEHQDMPTAFTLGDVTRFMKQLNEIEAMIQRNANIRLALNVLVLRMPYLVSKETGR
ncbi:MAG: DNA polymerase III subunit [Anaerolineae bacterium]